MPNVPILIGLLGALVVLAAHVRLYWFLTDDAYIAFRYARNLSHGFGLVFNPGHEAVEGYTSLLWVLLLALLDRIGVAPEVAANVLTMLATFAVWAGVTWFCWRAADSNRAAWLVLVPAWGLALNRSFAVWATSGLEARWFEALLVFGALRLVHEQSREDRGEPTRTLAPWFFALACLTRPEGAMFAGMAAASVLAWRARRRRLDVRIVGEWLPCAFAVAAMLVFRRLYYHDWLPNTWYAKVGGEFFWGSGFRYLTAFALEYGVWLWVLLIVAGVVVGRRRPGYLFLLAFFLIVPHLVYIAATGGDHFEYRPLGPEIILGFVLFHEAGRMASHVRQFAPVAGACALLVLVASTIIPWRSHQEFPADYRSGFPGLQLATAEGAKFLDPEDDPFTRLPGIRSLAAAHRDLTRELTTSFVAVRQEEHRLFLAMVVPAGRELGGLVKRGLLPRDVHIGIDCVGAIPYYSDVRTLDRLGLTDARVARSARSSALMAHSRHASMEYAREREVDLWARDPVQLLFDVSSRPMLRLLGPQPGTDTTYVADVGNGRFLLCLLPMGLGRARERFPRLTFMAASDPAFLRVYQTTLAATWRDSLARHPEDQRLAENLAMLFVTLGDVRAAIPIFENLVERGGGSPQVLEALAYCQSQVGLHDLARATFQKAVEEATRRGDTAFLDAWKARQRR